MQTCAQRTMLNDVQQQQLQTDSTKKLYERVHATCTYMYVTSVFLSRHRVIISFVLQYVYMSVQADPNAR